MNARDDLDRRLAGWMTEVGSIPAPTAPFERIAEATARSRPRSRWFATFGSDWVGRMDDRPALPAWPAARRQSVVAVGVAFLVAAAIAGAVLVGAQILRRERGPFPESDSNGWIAFDADSERGSTDSPDHDIYVIGQDQVARRIIGTDGDGLDQVCPTFSADGTQLAFGQGQGTDEAGYSNASLGLVDIDADGNVSNLRTIDFDGAVPAPCPVWSPDGLRLAFFFSDAWNGNYARPREAGSAWVVTLAGRQLTELPGVWANSMSWAPDGSRLAIASGNDPGIFPPVGGPILIYSVATGEVSPFPGATDVTAVAWSPDGSRIAYQRVKNPGTLVDGGVLAFTDTQEIWTIGADGRGRTLQTQPFWVNHGDGPMWSPTGDRIAYMRVCTEHPIRPAGRCYEQHDVVLLTPGSAVDEIDPVGNEAVLPLARTDTGQGPAAWFPYAISWSPDGQKLLYSAWSEPVTQADLFTSSGGLLVVDVDGRSPPILREVPVQSGSWGRLPGP